MISRYKDVLLVCKREGDDLIEMRRRGNFDGFYLFIYEIALIHDGNYGVLLTCLSSSTASWRACNSRSCPVGAFEIKSRRSILA
jgi:hypothetical protein